MYLHILRASGNISSLPMHSNWLSLHKQNNSTLSKIWFQLKISYTEYLINILCKMTRHCHCNTTRSKKIYETILYNHFLFSNWNRNNITERSKQKWKISHLPSHHRASKATNCLKVKKKKKKLHQIEARHLIRSQRSTKSKILFFKDPSIPLHPTNSSFSYM